jgi:hypothetical protein
MKKRGAYILKGMHCIWFNLNFKIVLAYDSTIKRKNEEIFTGEQKMRNDKDISSIGCG